MDADCIAGLSVCRQCSVGEYSADTGEEHRSLRACHDAVFPEEHDG